MERDKLTIVHDRADSIIFATVYTVLALVLIASLAAGGQDVRARSAGMGRVTNATAAPDR